VGATQTAIVPGLPAAATLSYTNADYSGTMLGPTIQVNEGDTVRMDVHNNLGEATTVHWHGLHLPAAADGNVMDPILPGAISSPEFMIRQEASTNWYHPHLMGETSKQIAMGLTGMFLINDGSAAEAALPHDYGVDDIPLILQSEVVDTKGQIVFDEGKLQDAGNTFPLLINGVNTAATVPTINPTSSRIRLRILNGSIGDILTLSFADGQQLFPFNEVATGGGFLPNPLPVTSVRVGPAERVEIVVDLTRAITLQATVEPALITGGSGKHPILQINPLNTTPSAPLPTTLNTIVPLNTAGSVVRNFNLTYDQNSPGGIFTGFGINGVVGDTMPAMMNNAISIPVGTTEIWNIINTQTPQTHFFHMHDGSFQILSINGALPTGDKVGWKDTVEVPPGTTVQIAFKFTDYTDTTKGYMLHCHLAPHEDNGMMALFYVVPSSTNPNRGRQLADLDGDGKSDYIVNRPWNQTWYVTPANGSASYMRQWGAPGDIPINGDFDGDGKSDIAVWRPSNGTWYVIPSSNPEAPFAQQWGNPGDIPLSGDFDGDGKTDFAVWRPWNGTWYIRPSSNPAAPITQQWGFIGDVPLVGDFDNDGKLDFVIWRPYDGMWYILPSSNPTEPLTQQWGTAGDTPLVGDFDGDGKNDFAVWRPYSGTWYVIPSSNPSAPFTQQWGAPGDVALARDFDGDKKTDIAVWRPSDGTWYIIPSTNRNAPFTRQWGYPGDMPM